MVRFIMTMFWAALIAKHQARAFSTTAPKSTRFHPSLTSSATFSWIDHRPSTRPMTCSSKYNRLAGGAAGGTRLMMSTATDLDDLNQKIKVKGDEIRQLKADGIEKADLAPHIEELLALKAQLPPEENATTAPPPKEKKKPQQTQKQTTKKVEEMSESELRLSRLSKVDAMREASVEPFEYTFDVTRSAAQLLSEYEGKLEGGEEDEESDVAVAGRIMTRRVFGKLAFFSLQDETGTIQLQFDKKRLGDTFKVSC